ncbi:recombinase family protein [Nonomuraea sp. NPDC026600]|uniref:recombinase family protein n=1 Tax=Nonomuraea sp. NPDC026600 TaxID=3155363 RepID=UPI0033DFEF63
MFDELVPVAAYARASLDLAKDAHTVQEQHRMNQQTAACHGWRIVHSYTDNDRSAVKEGVVREDFEAMLKALRAGMLPDGTPVMGVIVTADDRLARKASDYERFIDAFTSVPNRVFADNRTTKYLYSEEAESMGLLGALLSRAEAKKIRRRAIDKHRGIAETGKIAITYRAFGWNKDRKTLNPVASAAVRKAVEQVIAGRSLNSIVLEWQERGLMTTRGNKWSTAALKQLLLNPRTCGWRMLHGDLVMDAKGEPVVGEWEAIVTPDQWWAVRAIFEQRRGKRVNRYGVVGDLPDDYRDHRYLLTGVLRCGKPLPDGAMCMTKLRVGVRKKLGDYAYSCMAKSEGGCGGLARKGEMIDMHVSEAVISKLEEISLKAPEMGPWEEAELEEFKEQKIALRQAFAARDIKPGDFFAEMKRVDADIDRLARKRQAHAVAVERAQADVTDIRRRWYSDTDSDRLDLSQKRAYVRRVLHAIIVLPSGRTGRAPFDPNLLDLVWREDV